MAHDLSEWELTIHELGARIEPHDNETGLHVGVTVAIHTKVEVDPGELGLSEVVHE